MLKIRRLFYEKPPDMPLYLVFGFCGNINPAILTFCNTVFIIDSIGVMILFDIT